MFHSSSCVHVIFTHTFYCLLYYSIIYNRDYYHYIWWTSLASKLTLFCWILWLMWWLNSWQLGVRCLYMLLDLQHQLIATTPKIVSKYPCNVFTHVLSTVVFYQTQGQGVWIRVSQWGTPCHKSHLWSCLENLGEGDQADGKGKCTFYSISTTTLVYWFLNVQYTNMSVSSMLDAVFEQTAVGSLFVHCWHGTWRHQPDLHTIPKSGWTEVCMANNHVMGKSWGDSSPIGSASWSVKVWFCL